MEERDGKGDKELITCWMCQSNSGVEENTYGDFPCQNCGVLVSNYDPNIKPITPTTEPTSYDDYINQKAEQKEDKVIPEGKGSQFSAFLKLPNPLENKIGEISIGDKVTINSEFAPPTSPKLKSALIGTVNLANGEERTVGLNWTSYYTIAGVLGRDTKEWVGGVITYKGLKKFEKGTGHLWVVEK